MRFESPVTQGFRHVVEDVKLPSGTMPAGTNAVVWWAAANVDPEAFDDPLTVRLDRAPNAHICFASGWHRCLGSHLARHRAARRPRGVAPPDPRLPHRGRRRAHLLDQSPRPPPPPARLGVAPTELEARLVATHRPTLASPYR